MKLVLIAHRRGAAFQIRDVGTLVGDDQRALELAGILLVDAEVGRQLHRAAHALRHVDERSVGEHRRVQRGIVVVGLRHDRAQVLLHQLRMLAQRLGNRTEDDAGLGQLLLEGRDHRHAVEYGIDGDPRALHAGQQFLLFQRNAETLIGAQQLRIHLIEALRAFGALRRRIIIQVLEVDLRIVELRPGRLGHRAPAAIGLQPPFEHPRGLALLLRNEADDILVQPLRRFDALDLRLEPVLVLVDVDLPNLVDGLLNCCHDLLLTILSRRFIPVSSSRRCGALCARNRGPCCEERVHIAIRT